MWGICPFWAPGPIRGQSSSRLPLPMHTDAHGRAQSFAWLIWSARGSSRNSTGISEANRISCDPAAAQLDFSDRGGPKVTRPPRHKRPFRITHTPAGQHEPVTPARWTPCRRLHRTSARRPQIPLTPAGECTIRDSKCPSHSRQNVGSHRRQRSAVYAAPRVLAEQAVRQLTIVEGNVTPGRPAVSQGAHAQNRRHP